MAYAGRHRKDRFWRNIIVLATSVSVAAVPVTAVAVSAAPAAPAVHATLASSSETLGGRILDKAETRTNHLYSWGATGPTYFDCSGLVYWSATAAGLKNWPRDTLDIAWAWHHSSRFTRTYHPQRGDLALWGPTWAPYHVALVTIWSQTNFEAQHSGWSGRVTWHYDGWFRPSFYLHVNW
jgi:cell wall-associated NlpC family hydrolase